jgi:hypothetical protein
LFGNLGICFARPSRKALIRFGSLIWIIGLTSIAGA